MGRRLVGRTAELRRLRCAWRGGMQGAVIAGPAGVGKSRLVREWLVGSADRATVRVSGSATTESIPFGAFAHVLPDRLPADASPLEVLQVARRAIIQGAGLSGGLVVAVDDAHLLDGGSAALVHQLTDAPEAFVALTVRSGEQAPDPILAVGKDDRVEWIELEPLSLEHSQRLAEQLLSAPIDTVTMQQVWDRTGGNPLFVTELIRGGRESGMLVRDGELWRATGLLTASARLHEVLAARIRGLAAGERRALELLVAAERFELRLLEQLAGRDELEALEQAGLASVHRDRRRAMLAVAHPLYGEVARAETPELVARHVAANLAHKLDQVGLRRRVDLLRWAAWTSRAGDPAAAADLLAAARRAKVALDPELAERCADASVASGGGFEAALLHAEAVAAQGSIEEAHARFEQLAGQAEGNAERAQLALAHGTSLLLQAGDKRVLEALASALEVVTDPVWRDELEAMLVFAAAYLGELPRAVTEGGRLLDRIEQATPAVVRTAVIHTYVKALMGRYDEDASHLIDRGLLATEHSREAFPIGEHLLQVNRVFGLETSGRVSEAEQLARAQYEAAIASGTLERRGLWATNLGFALSFRGDLIGFARHLDEALAALRQRDPVGMLLLSLSLGALAHAMCGHRRRARRLLVEYDSHSQDRTPAFGTTWRHRVDAWLHPDGLGEDAARLALQAGEIAHREHQIAYGSLALHDAVRFGHPDLVLGPLEKFADVAAGELIPAFADHARLLSRQDPRGLEKLARRFERMGADLYAAETAAQASHLHTRVGADGPAHSARTRALALAGTGVCCPSLWQWIPRPAGLTGRELEIARLAATGLSDRDIAEQLTISPRTVGNHLTSVYSKLAISGRTELAEVLQFA